MADTQTILWAVLAAIDQAAETLHDPAVTHLVKDAVMDELRALKDTLRDLLPS